MTKREKAKMCLSPEAKDLLDTAIDMGGPEGCGVILNARISSNEDEDSTRAAAAAALVVFERLTDEEVVHWFDEVEGRSKV